MPSIFNFRGRTVHDYLPEVGIEDLGAVYRLRQLWVDHGIGFDEVFEAFAKDEKSPRLETLIIGDWGHTPGDISYVVSRLADLAPRLGALRYLVFGDISAEEQPITTISHGDMTPLLHAFPELVYLRVRGGDGLRFRGLHHPSLQKLIIETAGMSATTIEDIASATLGELAHLELWLGDPAYGYDATMDDLQPLLHGHAYPKMVHPFPKLERLGLRNAAEADAIAHKLRGARVLRQLRILDLSKGALTDAGVHALAFNPMIHALGKLNLRSNFVTDEDLVDRIRSVGVEVAWSRQKQLPRFGDPLYVDVSG